MKKILLCIFCLFYGVNAFAASKPTTVYVDTEQKYIFTSENLQETIPDFVEDENKQLEMVRLYQELMNQETGAVSVENLLAVCRAGGFNTYRQAGYAQCRAFVEKLLENAEQEAEEGFFGGFCPPAYDENGKQINGLKSINETTRVGDFCSSTNIAGGEVVFRKDNGYSCTCAAYACNPGYQSKGGACVTKVADGNGNCLRKEYSNVGSLSEPGAALKFCEGRAVKGCKVVNAIKNFPAVGNVTCNATQEELSGVKALNTACSMLSYPQTSENNTKDKCAAFCRVKAKENNCKLVQSIARFSTKECICNPSERSLASVNMYYEVCGKDKGKTGKKEYCVTDFFNWTQTQVNQALAFAQDYARLKHGNTVVCSNDHRKEWNDDYIKCATRDSSVYYEFKFDDIRESVDADRRLSEMGALCKLVNSIYDTSRGICRNIDYSTCTNKLIPMAQRYGYSVKWENNTCHFVIKNTMGSKEFEESLAKINGLDNRAFFNLQVISIRGNFVLEDEIESYVKKTISGVKKVTCDPGYNTVKVADGVLATIVGNSDDIKRCYVDGKPIDFVFDDLSEIMGYERKAGESGAKCVGNAGKYDGHYCRGLTKSECFELEEKLLSELKRKGWAGDKDLVDWDEKAGACELNDAQFANNINKTGKYTAIVGLTVTGVFTGGSTTAVAVSLMAVELAGIAGEMYTERKKELLPQQWADEFLAQSRNCKSASCAETTLRSNFGKIQQASDMLNRDVLKQVDNELARLAELLPDERFEQILNSADAPNCWETWECQEKIFMGMQMASLGVAVGKGLVNLTRVIAKKAGKAATKTSTAIVKASTKADDTLDIAKGPKKPTGSGPSGAGGADDAARGAGGADDAARNGSRTGGDGTGGSSANGSASGSGATGGARNAGRDVFDAGYFLANPSAVDDVFKNADGVVQIARQDMEVATLRNLMRNAERYGFSCAECGGDVLKFVKKADSATNAASDAGRATKAAEGATNASRGTTSASKALPAPVKTTEATQSSSRVAASATAKAADEISDAGRVTNTGSKAGKVADEAADLMTPAETRIDKFYKKYFTEDFRPKYEYTPEKWERILTEELGNSQRENLFKIDFRSGMGMSQDPAINLGTKVSKAANASSDAGRVANTGSKAGKVADEAADVGKASNNASKTTKAANLYEDWKVFGKGKNNYEFDFGVLGKSESELDEFTKLVKQEGYSVQKVGNKVVVKVAETSSEEAKKWFHYFTGYSDTTLDFNGWELPVSDLVNGQETVTELAKMLKKEGAYLQEVGGKVVVRKPGLLGWDLRQKLKQYGLRSSRYASDSFFEVHIRSGQQCATGLKFHVSVNTEDLETASLIVDDIVKRTDVADIWKVETTGMVGSQKGKDFTIYVSQNGYDADKIQGFLNELETTLKERNIRSNGFGSNVASGDKSIPGSNYINYRYDRTNKFGIPDGKYNGSYDFVAPNAEYGGDIMKGIGIR